MNGGWFVVRMRVGAVVYLVVDGRNLVCCPMTECRDDLAVVDVGRVPKSFLSECRRLYI